MTRRKPSFLIDLDQPLVEQELVKNSFNGSSEFKEIKFEQLLEIAKMVLKHQLDSDEELRGLRLEFQSSLQAENKPTEAYVLEWSQKPLKKPLLEHLGKTNQSKEGSPLSTDFLGRLTERLDEALSQTRNDSHITSFKIDLSSNESLSGYLDCKGDPRCKKNGLEYKAKYVNDEYVGCTNILCGKKPDNSPPE